MTTYLQDAATLIHAFAWVIAPVGGALVWWAWRESGREEERQATEESQP